MEWFNSMGFLCDLIRTSKARRRIDPVPTPYDISGSAHWRNKADNCLTLWRDEKEPDRPVQLHVQKISTSFAFVTPAAPAARPIGQPSLQSPENNTHDVALQYY
jgi:hypothetical protein